MKKNLLVLMAVILLAVDAQALTTFTVRNTNDSGAESLRQAISDAVNPLLLDSVTIAFDIPTADPNYVAAEGYWKITLATPFVVINKDNVTIDGSTQTTNRGDTNPYGPEIMLDGSSLPSNDGSTGFVFYDDNCLIKNLVVSNFYGSGIMFFPSTAVHHNTIAGCYIGTDPTGTASQENGVGVYFGFATEAVGGPQYNTVGGQTAAERNIISGNRTANVTLFGTLTGSNEIIGNYIGIDRTGTLKVGNAANGIISYYSSFNTIESNVISGHSSENGIAMSYNGYNHIKSNKIGTDANGTAAIPNGGGIQLGHFAMTAAAYYGHNLIENNLISGNSNGLLLFNADNGTNEIIGNYIGTNASGTAALANTTAGILICSPGNTIGGTTAATRNIIAGNEDGIQMLLTNANNNRIIGNYVGLNAAGTAAIGNHNGINMNTANNNVIGGSTAAERNVISGNFYHGVGEGYGLQLNSCSGNVISGNYIGLNAAGDTAISNEGSGVRFGDAAVSNTVSGNVISGNGWGIDFNGATSNEITNNTIGLDAAGTTAIPNTSGAVFFQGNTKWNVVGPGNTIAQNPGAILVSGANAIYNRITQNTIYGGTYGIALSLGGNESLASPIITALEIGSSNASFAGTGPGSSLIEVFQAENSSPFSGKTYLGSTTEVGAAWSFLYNSAVTDVNFTATATDSKGNTSAFGTVVTVTTTSTTTGTVTTTTTSVTTTTTNSTEEVTVTDIAATPAAISLSFASKSSGVAVFHILDLDGRQTAQEPISNVNIGANLVNFNLAKRLPRGPYIYVIELNGRLVKRGKFTVTD